MRKTTSGFTIVELLIVIVVIGILAAITVVSYSNIQQRARNTTRLAEVRSWSESFEVYNAAFGNYPLMPFGTYCLGDFSKTDNKCRDWKLTGSTTFSQSNATALMTELLKVGSLPSGEHIPVNDTVGPYVSYPDTNTSISIIGVFDGNSGECPGGLEQTFTDNKGKILCRIKIVK